MGNLADAMQSLVDEISSSTQARHNALRQLRNDFQQMRNSIRLKLSEMRSDTHNLIERCRLERKDRADEIRQQHQVWTGRGKKKFFRR